MSTARSPDAVTPILRIIETPPRYPPFIGGVENVAQAVCSRLLARGDDILVVCADEPRGGDDDNDGVPVRRLPWRFKIANTNITLRLPFVLARSNWHVVSTHMPTPWSADWSVIIARLLGRGSVLCVHTTIAGDGWASPVARLYIATIFRLILRLANRIIVLSEFWRDELLSIDKSIADRLKVIPNGIDLDRFTPGRDKYGQQLLFVGVLDRFHRFKGLDTLLHAMKEIQSPCELTVIGDGELRGEYEQVSSGLGLAQRVRFIGALNSGSDALINAYQNSDVCVVPSRRNQRKGQEGLPLVALEAMATGVPTVIADGVGQLAHDIESAGAGIRVPADDPRAIATAVDRLLSDKQERIRMGEAARTYVVRNHSWDDIALRRRSIYLEAAQDARSRRKRRSALSS